MKAFGHDTWIIPGGRIPAQSTGREPDFTSRDELWFLNAGNRMAEITILLYYDDRDPVGPYHLRVDARRVSSIRINDLIDPEAPPLERDYAAVVHSNVPIVVQSARYDTRRAEQAMSWSLAFPVP